MTCAPAPPCPACQGTAPECPGPVTGKTTTLRIILGLDTPTAGDALVGGRPYQRIIRPLHQPGAMLDANALHVGRSARHHLLAIARSNGIGAGRVTEVLELTGLDAVARRRAGGFSLGMKQRLGIAAALLGDPPVLMFDEPANGLAPRASTGSGSSSGPWPRKAARSSCPVT